MKIKSHEAAILSYIAKLAALQSTAEVQMLIKQNIERLKTDRAKEVAKRIVGDDASDPIAIAYRSWARRKAKSPRRPMFAR